MAPHDLNAEELHKAYTEETQLIMDNGGCLDKIGMVHGVHSRIARPLAEYIQEEDQMYEFNLLKDPAK